MDIKYISKILFRYCVNIASFSMEAVWYKDRNPDIPHYAVGHNIVEKIIKILSAEIDGTKMEFKKLREICGCNKKGLCIYEYDSSGQDMDSITNDIKTVILGQAVDTKDITIMISGKSLKCSKEKCGLRKRMANERCIKVKHKKSRRTGMGVVW